MKRKPWNKGLKTAGKMINCQYCGKEFYVRPIEIKRNKKFCSMECFNKSGYRSSMQKGKAISLESRKKMSESKKKAIESGILKIWNKGLTKETDKRVEKYSRNLKGRNFSEETRRKISESKKEFHKKNPEWGELQSKNRKKYLKEHPESIPNKNPEILKKMIETQHMKGQINSHVWVVCYICGQLKELENRTFNSRVKAGVNHFFCSKKCESQWRSFRYALEKHPNWRGGKSFEPYTTEFNEVLKQAVRNRDNQTCKICGMKEQNIHHNVHHINYKKDDCSLDNLITLCHACHTKTNFNRKYWMKFFKQNNEK